MNSFRNEDLLPFYKKLSYEEKFADDAKWIGDCVNTIDRYLGYTDIEYYTKLDVNYAIAKGKSGSQVYHDLLKHRQLQDKQAPIKIKKNYDIISPIYKAMAGEQQKRELFAIAKDVSGYNQNMFKKKKLSLYQDWVQNNIYKPMQAQATQEVLLKHQIPDPKQLTPEQQQEINAEIQQVLDFKSPKDIDKFMTQDYKSPTETQLQELLNWGISEFNIKFITDESFKHLLLSGREISYNSIERYKPVVKILNPKGFKYVGKDNTFFIGEGEQWSYEEFISYSDLMTSIPSDSNLLDAMNDIVSKYGVTGSDEKRKMIRGEAPGMANEVISVINTATDGEFLRKMPTNLLTGDAQSYLSRIYTMFGNGSIVSNKLRKVNICYTAFSKGYLVQRYNPKLDMMDQYWVGENYETNPELDASITEYWFPEFYQADKLGYGSDLIYNKKRVEFQNRSVLDPWDIIPPYDGIEYSKLFNNADIVTPIDAAKAYQEEYNTVKEKIEELDRTNIGKIFAIPESFIPTDWTIEKFVEHIKESKIAIINENNSSLNPAIASQILKSIDATNNADIVGYINRLQAIRAEAETAMSYSPSSLGQAPASITATTNQQNVIQSSYKTEDIFSLHSIFVNRLLRNMVLMIRNALTKNEELKQALLSIPSLAALNIDTELLLESVPFIEILNKSNEVKQVNDVKELLQPMLQNKIIRNISDVMKIQFKNNPAELLNLAEDAERKADAMMEQQQKIEQENLEKDRQLQRDIAKDAQEFEKYKFDKEQETLKYVSDNDTRKFQRQADSDENRVPDSVQVALINKGKEENKAAIVKETKEEELLTLERIARINAANKKTT